MAAEPLESAYPSVMEDFARRVLAAENALDEVLKNPGHENNWTSCELAVVQIRKICELVLLGSTLAHVDHGEAIDDRKWRPKDVFAELDQVNAHPLPIPIVIEIDKNGPGAHHAIPKSKPLMIASLSKVYGVCGDLLHVPSARQVISERMPAFDVGLLNSWLAGLKALLMGHALMLPNRQKILICTWDGKVPAEPKCFMLEAQGESTLDVSCLPEFGLI